MAGLAFISYSLSVCDPVPQWTIIDFVTPATQYFNGQHSYLLSTDGHLLSRPGDVLNSISLPVCVYSTDPDRPSFLLTPGSRTITSCARPPNAHTYPQAYPLLYPTLEAPSFC